MKKHAIIPIFIPHKGCPHDCIFCNQKKITARMEPFEARDVERRMEEYLPTIENRGIETVEAAFFGGSFTGIPMEEQRRYLAVAKAYKDSGRIGKIRLSTRPDYIDEEILGNLRDYGVDLIELGVQSLDPEVLRLSERGHTKEQVYGACAVIKEWGFELGVQLMIGLPGDTPQKSIASAQEAAELAPSAARLYPTVILQETRLSELYHQGEFIPFSQEDMLYTTKEMYRILDQAKIPIIRVGLKSTDLISESGAAEADTYHPAFRQLVEGQLAREDLERDLQALLKAVSEASRRKASLAGAGSDESSFASPLRVSFLSCRESFSNMIGNNRANKLYFEERFPSISFRFKVDSTLPRARYRAVIEGK